jgi:hypothetical protein
MDIDRFWQLIEQARDAAGPEADRAIRDDDLRDEDPDHDYWNFDDEDLKALVQGDAGLDDLEQELEEDDEDGDGEDEEDLTDPVATALFELLTKLPAAEIGAFDNVFEDVRAGADQRTLANAAMLIEHGFLGDDSFDDFRAGLVALGRKTFENALANPDSLADHPVVKEIAGARDPRWLGREDLLFVASHAYATVTGEPEITFFEFAEALREDAEESASPDAMTDGPDGTVPEADNHVGNDREGSGHEGNDEDWEITQEAEARRRLPRLSELFYERSMRNRQRALDKLGLQG